MRPPHQIPLIPPDTAPLPVAFPLSPGAVFGVKKKGLPRHYLPLAPHVTALTASTELAVKERAILALIDPVVLTYLRYLVEARDAGVPVEEVDIDALITVNQALDIFGAGVRHGATLTSVLRYARDVHMDAGYLVELLEEGEDDNDP